MCIAIDGVKFVIWLTSIERFADGQAPSLYWELEVCSTGDAQEESGPFISLGFMPAAERRDSGWTQPVGSCLFHK